LVHGKTVPTPCEEYGRILDILETQLAALDRAGAHKAAAHLDASIQQLRRDEIVLQLAEAGHTPTDPADEDASISDRLTEFHVVPRKANPANVR